MPLGHTSQEVAPVKFWNSPDEQLVQVDDPEVSAYLPARQSVHSGARAPEEVPATQAEQFDDPILLHLPTSQSVHEGLASSL